MQISPDPLQVAPESVPVPGLLYPDRCLECPEILWEGYGCGQYARCAECVAGSGYSELEPCRDGKSGYGASA